jgi:hypothetical protein
MSLFIWATVECGFKLFFIKSLFILNIGLPPSVGSSPNLFTTTLFLLSLHFSTLIECEKAQEFVPAPCFRNLRKQKRAPYGNLEG